MNDDGWIDIERACDMYGLDEHHYRQFLKLQDYPVVGDKTRVDDITEALNNEHSNKRKVRLP